ncbi:hypothetical protein LTR62_003107 [Meristemomyces frigidus]|uniref:Glutaminase n=1 Tax=Meristemomyces frigidus TaxID=1508187 RepID=A0AAN7TLP0_9PEZI|nr:hypothetical protein LTR62_003107 [Meristemomyces frigidus]
MELCLLAKLSLFFLTVLLAETRISDGAKVSLPSYPLAVKSPYLSAWVPGNQLIDAATAQPVFWQGQSLTWPVLARVGKKTYALFGLPHHEHIRSATTTGVNYTSTHTLIELTAGSVQFTLDFLSPVCPGVDDYAEQSLPYSYLTLTATNTDRKPISVQVLSGIDRTWTAQNGADNINYTTSGDVGYFSFHNSNQVIFAENNEMARYGTIVFGMLTGHHVTSTCCAAKEVYSTFAHNGKLKARETCNLTDLAAMSYDLGKITPGASSSATFAVGLDRVEAIDFLGEAQTGYYRSKWPTTSAALAYFLDNYESAYQASMHLDALIRSKAEAVSSTFGNQYADLVEASVRQTFATFELTVPAEHLTATPQVFLKEISSDGNIQTIDLIFQSWPIFVSLNPNYIRMLLQPILSYLQAGRWPHPWVIHDLGYSYPNATGHDDGKAEQMPLFETSSLFLLIYTYVKFTSDETWITEYLPLLEGYAQYLITHSLYPPAQLISVDAIHPSPNQTALAMQSAIALNAASLLLHNTSYAETAAFIAHTIYFEGLGLDGATPEESKHFTHNYGNDNTWNVVFCAYTDVLLNLSTFPAAAWEMQSRWYLEEMQEYGLAFAGPAEDLEFDGGELSWGLLDWNMVAAAASSVDVQAAVVNTSHAFLSITTNTAPFGTKYQVQGPDAGKWIGNKARSTVGSMFALLALQEGVLDLT